MNYLFIAVDFQVWQCHLILPQRSRTLILFLLSNLEVEKSVSFSNSLPLGPLSSKPGLLAKIHMLFCNEFSICTIFADSMPELHTPGAGGPGVQLPEVHGFSIWKAQDTYIRG